MGHGFLQANFIDQTLTLVLDVVKLHASLPVVGDVKGEVHYRIMLVIRDTSVVRQQLTPLDVVLLSINSESRAVWLYGDGGIQIIAGQLLAAVVSRGPVSVDDGPWLALKSLDPVTERGHCRPVMTIVIPTDHLPLGRVTACDVDLKLQAGGQDGLSKEFSGMGRVKLVPLVDPAADVD